MNQDIEKLLSAPPDDFERSLFFAERVLHQLEEMLAHSKRVSQTLDRSYDLLLTGLVESGDDADDEDTALADKTRAMVRQYRDFRDTDCDKLLTMAFCELHKLHQLYRDKAP